MGWARFIKVLLVASFLPSSVCAEVWDWRCERAIKRLKDAQEQIATAKNDMDSAESFYSICKPSRYRDCGLERMTLENAIDDYNRGLSEFDFALSSFKKSCLE